LTAQQQKNFQARIAVVTAYLSGEDLRVQQENLLQAQINREMLKLDLNYNYEVLSEQENENRRGLKLLICASQSVVDVIELILLAENYKRNIDIDSDVL